MLAPVPIAVKPETVVFTGAMAIVGAACPTSVIEERLREREASRGGLLGGEDKLQPVARGDARRQDFRAHGRGPAGAVVYWKLIESLP